MRLGPSFRDEYILNGGNGAETENEPESEQEEGDEGEDFVCELESGATVPISSTSEQLVELRAALNNGTLISAISTVGVVEDDEEEVIAAMKPDPSDSNPQRNSVTLPPGGIRLHTSRRRLAERSHRRLARYSGNIPALVVRVTDSLGRAVPQDAAEVSNKFFGTGNDRENMKSQFASCSMGNFNIVHNQYGPKHGQIVSKLSAPGVMEVRIGISLDNPPHVIRDAVQAEVEERLGLTLPDYDAFGHVLYVLEGCYQNCGWAAYAYVNSWLSVYKGHYYSHAAVQMHEMGHNLNLAHSGGLDGESYTDHSCLMGNPLFSDEVGDMCFNPAKNWQIVMTGEERPGKGNWYDAGRLETYDSTVHGKKWRGGLVGIAEYEKLGRSFGNLNDKIVLQLETGTDSDYYVGFNRATGINSDNQEASDLVTVVETGGNGRTYSQSMLRAVLGRGQTYKVDNWRGGGEALVVRVEEIDASQDLWVATVEVVVGDGVSDPTGRPTKIPTRLPTNVPTMQPTNYPTKQPTGSPTSKPTTGPTKEPTVQPTNYPTKQPTKYPTNSPTKQPTGSPTSRPTNDPTKEPTVQPTNYPTKQPTGSPTSRPTSGPTKEPTAQPTNYPTNPPTNYPTKEPTGAPSRTNQPTISLAPTYQPTTAFPSWGNTILPTRLGGGEVEGGDAATIQFPDTFFEPNRVSNGTMFTVTALQDLSISALSTYTSEVSEGLVQVYVRPGSYVPHTASDEGWTLIFNQEVYQRGYDELTHLGPFLEDQLVYLRGGDSVSFYVYTTEKLSYHYSDEWSEGITVADDGSLKMYAGIALAYGKWESGCGAASLQPDGECKFAPRVFSGQLEYSLSTPTTTTTTTAPIPSIEFSTPNRKKAQSDDCKGITFTLEAKQNIILQGMSIVAMNNIASEVHIYTRNGIYTENSLTNSDDGWTLLYEGKIPEQQNKLVDLDDFGQGLRLAAGEVRSFYVFSRKGLFYTDGEGAMAFPDPYITEGTPYAEDSSIVIYEGRGTKGLFRRPLETSGKWAGILRYHNDS